MNEECKKQNKAKQTNLTLIISLSQHYGSRTVALNFGCTFLKITEIFKTTSAHSSILSEVRIYRAGDEGVWEWWRGWHGYFFQVSQVTLREGNGTPLQHSCLENSMDRGAWWAVVHGVAKCQALLNDFTFTFHFHALEKEMATHSSVLAWRIPETGEPHGLPSMGSHRVGHE